MIESYPLYWPPGRPRREPHRRRTSQFQTSRAKAISGLLDEIRKLGGRNPIISSNLQTYERGGQEIPYANQRVDDSGVAVYFELKGEEKCFALDLYKNIDDNIHAIELTISALRGIERWGGGELMDAAFRGFQALPSPDMVVSTAPQWFAGLQTVEERKKRYRELVKELHPDAGGDVEQFREMKRQYEQFQVKTL